MIVYIIECIIFQFLFLLVYELFLRQETFFQVNRFYLLGSFLLAWVLPSLELELIKEFVPGANLGTVSPRVLLEEAVLIPAGSVAEVTSPFSIIGLLCILGSGLSLIFFLFKWYSLARLRARYPVQQKRGYRLVEIAGSKTAFSFMSTIYLGSELSDTERRGILAHELVHIRERHSYDLLFFEIFGIIAWFNPMLYAYRNRVRELHEYLADRGANSGNGERDYQQLLQQVFQTQNFSFINPFFKSSLIKKRIVMLKKDQSQSRKLWKFAVVLPLLAGMLTYTSCQDDSRPVDKESDLNTTELSAKQSKAISFMEVDVPPVFPGCEDAMNSKDCFRQKMMEHIMQNFRYPEEAMKEGVEGRVLLTFTVMADGSVGKLQYESPDDRLSAEAVRIIEALPDLEPARQDGQAVAMHFGVPITFKLQ